MRGQGEVSKTKKNHLQSNNSSKTTCLLYPLQTKLHRGLPRGFRLRRKQLPGHTAGLCPSTEWDLQPKGSLYPTGGRIQLLRDQPVLLPWHRWALHSPAGLQDHLAGHAHRWLPRGCPFRLVFLSAVPYPIAKVNEETWEQA